MQYLLREQQKSKDESSRYHEAESNIVSRIAIAVISAGRVAMLSKLRMARGFPRSLRAYDAVPQIKIVRYSSDYLSIFVLR
jgi:hypothetical protein